MTGGSAARADRCRVSPACNASNSGNLPTAAEVSYAIFLLTGKDAIASSVKVPRWTLADGRTS